MHVLVTGGGGYLGTVLTGLLANQGHRVRVFDRFCFLPPESAPDTLFPGLGDTVEIISGDMRRLQDSPNLLAGMDAVIHLAGLANDPSCDLDEDMAQDVNTESTRELARKCVESGVKRFVFASSCAVYGRGVFEFLDEESPVNPVSSLARTKLQAEQALLSLAGENFDPVIARMATLFGLSPRMRFDLAVNQMAATAAQQARIVVRGGGAQWRPFLHVRDAARALALLASAEAGVVAGQVFNVGDDGQNIRIRDLADRVARHFENVSVEIAKDDDDKRDFRVRFQKAHERLGFSAETGIDAGVGELRRVLSGGGFDPFDEMHINVARMKRLRATPVEEGGEPVAARFVPLGRPCLGPEEEEAVLGALRSGWLTSGPQVRVFETMLADTVGAAHSVALSSCTAALHLCLVHLGLKPGDEVITSPITWASTGNTLLNMGLRVKFTDVEPDTLNMSPDALEAAITDRTRVIMPVHMAGHPCRMDEIRRIAEKHNLTIVEDAAHALGALYKGEPVGSRGDYNCFSFYATKNITTMEGGAVTTASGEVAGKMRMLAANGMAATAWDRYGRSAVPTPAQVVEPGFKYAMGNVGAAMGVEQLKKFPSFKAMRARLAGLYREALAEVGEIALPVEHEWAGHAWHLFIIRLRLDRLTCGRDEIAQDLRRENIGTGVHFYGLHLHPHYRDALGMRPEDCPEATRASQDILSLPLHPMLSDKDLHGVVSAVKKVLAHRCKKA